MLNQQRAKFEQRVRALAAFGHRGSATDHERKARDYLLGQLQSMGLEPVCEPFAGSRSLGARILVHVLVAAVGAACFWHVPVVSLVLALVALISLWMEHSTRGAWLSRPLVRYPSANLTARISTASPQLRIVVCGHCDTQRTGFMWFVFAYLGPLFWWVPALFKPPLTTMALIMAAQVVLAVVAMVHGGGPILTKANWAILALYAFDGVFLAEWAMGPYIQGAGDNATGVAAVLALGEEWLREPVEGVELSLVFLGCEEGGLLGSAEWATRHREEFREVKTVFLNLDNLGFGPPRFFRSEVPLIGLPRPYPPALIDAAAETARELGLKDAGPHSMPGPTDALSFLERGMQGMSIVSFGKWGFMPTYHRLLDNLENLDFDEAWQATVFGSALLRRIVGRQTAEENENPDATKQIRSVQPQD